MRELQAVLGEGQLMADTARVVEPDMDMMRTVPQASSFLKKVSAIFKGLMPANSSAPTAPMRSVARELEEVFPSND